MIPEKAKKKSLRVALIASERTVTEFQAFLERLLVGLSEESISIALVCPQNCNLDSIVLGSAEVIRYDSIGLPLVDYFNKRLLIESLAKFKPTILHCLCETQAVLVRQLASRLNLPYILMINSLQERWSRLAVSLKQCVKVVVPAQSIAANITRFYPRLAGRLQQINIGTFTDQNRCCFSGPSGITAIVTAHYFHNADEFENLFTALRHLRIEGHEFMVVVIGGGGRAEEKMWKLLAALGLLQIVTIVPGMTPWKHVLSVGDIFIQPQPISTFNALLLEAMSVGTAVAGCRGGVDDLIIENETAVVFDPNDELSIVGSLQLLLSRREFARKIANNAKENLKKNYSVSHMIAKTLQLYNEA